jgi:hypothetical protein
VFNDERDSSAHEDLPVATASPNSSSSKRWRRRPSPADLDAQVVTLEQNYPNSFARVLLGLYLWGGWLSVRAFLYKWPRRNWKKFRDRGFMFHHLSSATSLWNWAMVGVAFFTTAFIPLHISFPAQVSFAGHVAVERVLDAVCVVDIVVQFRTTYRDHGCASRVSTPRPATQCRCGCVAA